MTADTRRYIVIESDRRHGERDSRSIRERIFDLVVEGSIAETKFFLAMYFLGQAAGFFWGSDGCELLACAFVAAVLPWYTWGCIFLVLGCAELWRALDGVNRPRVAGVIHFCSGCVMSALGFSVLVARWPYWVLSVPHMFIAMAAFWVFARVAIYPGRGFRGC